jgi:hypothetical protein
MVFYAMNTVVPMRGWMEPGNASSAAKSSNRKIKTSVFVMTRAIARITEFFTTKIVINDSYNPHTRARLDRYRVSQWPIL